MWAGKGDEGANGSSQCGAVQQAVQLAIGDFSNGRYSTHQEYLETVSLWIDTARRAHLVSEDCAECVRSQFRVETPVAQQASCGTAVPPSSVCSPIEARHHKVHAASILAFSAAPNMFGDPVQFVLWSTLTQEILGCVLDSGTTSASGIAASNGSNAAASSSGAVAPPVQSKAATTATGTCMTCAAPGVNYCGYGNSGNPTNLVGPLLPTVAPCLNDACCNHDNCYAQTCESFLCYFSPQTSQCDAPLLAACMGLSSAEYVGWTAAICVAVTCGTASMSATSLCTTVQANRFLLTPWCKTPCNGSCCGSGTNCVTTTTSVPGAIAGVCCPPGAMACGTTCCASPGVCLNGTCAAPCQSGTTACGTNCCSSAQTCTNGQCVTTCPTGTTACGTNCCSSLQTCSNGQCISGCGACLAGEVCCNDGPSAAGPGVPICLPAGYVCCPSPAYGACPPYDPQCCNFNGTEFCCPTGSLCCGSTLYGPGGWCCPSNSSCGTGFEGDYCNS